MIRLGLRLLEEEENKILVLKGAIKDCVESRFATNFNSKIYLENRKKKKEKMANYMLTNKAVEDLPNIWNL